MLNRKTVIRYQHYEHYPARHQPVSRQSTVLPWRDYLVKQWNEGEHRHRHLWQQIKLQGFTGHPLSVYRFLAQFKGAEAKIPELEIKNWTPNRVQFLLTKADKDLQPRQQAFLAVFFQHCPLAITARKLALEFRALLEEKNAELLPTWIQQAKTSGINAIQHFAKGLEKDYEAVKAAATYIWSNGPVEGHINRLKTIKRQMYGRANFDLLRKRVLYYADTS
jgi:transposase